MPTAFVAGATGFTGREIVRLLAAQGVRTVAHVRPGSPRGDALVDRFQALGAQVDRTPWTPDAMRTTLAALRPDVVFCVLGITRAGARHEARATGDAPATYDSVDFGLTAMLVDAAAACGCRPRLVYLSATGTGPGAATAYGRARHRAEEAVRASGLPFVIARPGLISGPGRDDPRPGERVADVLLGAFARAAGRLGARDLAHRVAPIDGTALARALVHAALAPDSGDRVVLEAAALWTAGNRGAD